MPPTLPTHRSILPACAKLAEAGDSEVREAGQAALVAFAVRCGSMGILDKVGGSLTGHLLDLAWGCTRPAYLLGLPCPGFADRT